MHISLTLLSTAAFLIGVMVLTFTDYHVVGASLLTPYAFFWLYKKVKQ